jgi:hypothetical protein
MTCIGAFLLVLAVEMTAGSCTTRLPSRKTVRAAQPPGLVARGALVLSDARLECRLQDGASQVDICLLRAR